MGVPSLACVSAKAALRKETKVVPSGRSPVCRRRYVGKGCDVTREIPECAAPAEPQQVGPIRYSAEVVPSTTSNHQLESRTAAAWQSVPGSTPSPTAGAACVPIGVLSTSP
jgi:hypothetical protein